MSKNLHRANEIMSRDEYTCVFIKDDRIYTSKERGVEPLLTWLEDGEDMQGASAADKVVGKAAAFLYVKLQIKELYAGVISAPACAVLEQCEITVQYGQKVDAIRNRANTGFCPMETAVLHIEDADAALAAIKEKVKSMQVTIPANM